MEEKTKKRGWVKDAAIVFLAVLLILTFFSSTILNRSLPEVATAYVTDGTITSKVRGTGTVLAKENYDVIIDQTHKVDSVLVHVGDTVQAGDVLIILEPGDSTEIDAAKEQLASLQDQYQRMLINASSSDYAKEDRNIEKARKLLEEYTAEVEELKITPEETAEYEQSYAEAEALIDALEQKIEDLEDQIDAAQAKIDAEADSVTDVIWEKKSVVAEKQAIVDEKQAVVDEKQEIVDAQLEVVNEIKKVVSNAEQKMLEAGTTSNAALQAATERLHAAEDALEAAERDLAAKLSVYSAEYQLLKEYAEPMIEEAFRSMEGIDSSAVLTAEQIAQLQHYTEVNLDVYLPFAAKNHPELSEAYSAISAAQSAVKSAGQTYNSAMAEQQDAQREYNKSNSNNVKYNQAKLEKEAAEDELDAAQDVYDAAEKVLNAAKKELTAAQSELTKAQADENDTLAVLRALESGDSFSLTLKQAQLVEEKTDLETKKADLQKQLTETKADADELKADYEKREAELEAATSKMENQQDSLEDMLFSLEQQKKNDGVSDQLAALDRQKLLDQIDKQKAEIEELTGDEDGTEVVSRVTGTVQSINVTAGREAKANDVLATIEVPDLGYSMTFSVTNDQARRLKVGDTATVSNYYWGSQILAELVSMKTDPQNPQGSKQLTFDVTGDVTPGSSLTISIGDKNQNYDMVVPNSAIRSDVNGSFVLKITAKNSPLGNRYFATRVNVEVVASDEKYSAISGAVEAYDSVVTTASRNAPISAGDQVRLADSNT